MRQDHNDYYDGNRDNFRISVPTRSAPTTPLCSPLVSPNKGRYSDFVQYHYVSPKPNQFWSAPEMAASPEALPGTSSHSAFFDLNSLPTDNSPIHSSPGRSPHRYLRSSSEASSPIHPRLSLESSPARRDFNGTPLTVHPLPLPPGASSLTPSPKLSPTVAKSEFSSMKSQWQKGKLIGRGTFGSVYVATNRYIKNLMLFPSLPYLVLKPFFFLSFFFDRETGALCAMKEVEIFPDDPKSAECIKQLEQVVHYYLLIDSSRLTFKRL